MKTERTFRIAVLVLAGAALVFAGRGCSERNRLTTTITRIDTIVIRDTIRDTVPIPVTRRIVRTDTVFVRAAGDTVFVDVEIPVEQKIYETTDYRAVVEGFRPALVEMELYRNTAFVTRETLRAKAPEKWGIGLQAGWGISPKGAAGYIGVGVQYRILAW